MLHWEHCLIARTRTLYYVIVSTNFLQVTLCLHAQELHSGVRIFTGSECVKWFLKNMVGVTTIQAAQVRGEGLYIYWRSFRGGGVI